jgi:hypothetical protein
MKDRLATVQKRPLALQIKHPAQQNMDSFIFLRVIFAHMPNLDRDQQAQLNAEDTPIQLHLL